ncbi:N(6)-adenine-specific DNA methyltransferase 2 [Syncephalis fuscata]|nr:N(6)-adenine-specific DNA methyltransferase 2 [Syncephalis fuscata]
MNYNSDDEPVQLSSHALAALKEFLVEEQEHEERFTLLKEAATKRFDEVTTEGGEGNTGDDPLFSIELFKEDWQLSQFWYDDDTARKLAQEAVKQAGDGQLIVCISAPSVFIMLKKLRVSNPLLLLEYDERFAVFKNEFCYYDYNEPLAPFTENEHLRGSAAVVVVDPPFLNESCFTKIGLTARTLANEQTKYIVNTGWKIQEIVLRELPVFLTAFEPRHRNGLANDFRCFINYNSDVLGFASSI